jgi:transcription antitermination factor NusG
LHLTGIAGHAGRPFRITDQEFEEMTTLPKRILEKRMQAEKAKIVSVGDRVEVIDGPMKGWIVDVCEMKGKIATMLIPILGERKVQIDLDRLRKIERA